MKKFYRTFLPLLFLLTSCNLPSASPADLEPASVSATVSAPTETPPATATLAPATQTFTPAPPPTETFTPEPTAIPFVESLDATVTADLLSCRYGPGSEYLYFYGFKKGFKLKLVGRTNANNWVMVGGLDHLCWVNKKFIEIQGDPQTLKVTYPGEYTLPVSPYYAPTTVLSAVRNVNDPRKVTVSWAEIALRAGDEEDENMFIYIIEVWRCEGGQSIFDPLASNYPEVTFIDEPGCDTPSHGRVYFQEKHGFAGPAEIPWPAQP